ncbi:hypothetical protein [Streptomyces sp. NPDC055681]
MKPAVPRARFTPADGQQLLLFRMPPNYASRAALRRKIAEPDSEMLVHCDQVLRDHAARHGWSKKLTNEVKRSLKLLVALQANPGAKIQASDVLELPRLGGTALSTIEILEAAGLLVDDRTTAVHRYFEAQTAGLPEPMASQLRLWFTIMLEGSPVAPRRRKRDPATIHLHIGGMSPIVRTWATEGHSSLVEITAEDVLTALPPGNQRYYPEQGLRSLFSILKARKQIFHNPIRNLAPAHVAKTIPIPLDTAAIREALNSPDPAVALAVALVAFHALSTAQVRGLQLTDFCDGHLNFDGRSIPLAGPVRTRLDAYLGYRTRTWPETTNPYVFINRRTAPRTTPVSRAFPKGFLGINVQALREDRILQEIHATGGDVRRICDLFGLSISGALRYAAVIEHPDFRD